MNWVQINIQVNEDFRYMKIHIFALRWRDEIKGSSQLYDIFETNALLEVNSKQPNILQFALTRVKRSKRQLQCDQFTSSTELVKPNYLVTLAVSILCTWFLTPERSVTQIRVGLEMNASLVSLHLNAKYCHPHNLRRLLISIRGWTHGHLFKGA